MGCSVMKERLTTRLMTAGCMLRYSRAVGVGSEVWEWHLCLLFFSSCTLIISIFFIAHQRANVINFPVHSLSFRGCICRSACPMRWMAFSQTRVVGQHTARDFLIFGEIQQCLQRLASPCLIIQNFNHSITRQTVSIWAIQTLWILASLT